MIRINESGIEINTDILINLTDEEIQKILEICKIIVKMLHNNKN